MFHPESGCRFRNLLDKTAGLVFLGTPFRGTKWQALADAIAWIMRPAGSHRNVIEVLGYDEPVLRDKLDSFCRLRNTLSIPVACFYELYETDCGKRLGWGGMVKGMVCNDAN